MLKEKKWIIHITQLYINPTNEYINAVNKYLASYRALNRIKNDHNGLYVEKVIGRFNVPEALGYPVNVALDVKEQQYIAVGNNLPANPLNIFQRQKYNLNNLLTALGDSQRAYNKNEGLRPVIIVMG